MSTSNRKYKDSVFVDRQRLYIRVQSLTSSFEQSSKHRDVKTTAIRGGTEGLLQIGGVDARS
ncbi:hypothetical protein [Treponema putidum]|uniref:Uncharacterized protein n=1 Tax=Treponema putidum TaxID=221027 RepID=A0ABY5HVZ4_9SPIR|nr:hypothetical protein [Treponema putidum]UTY29603.1 hypothetical protein E4N76_11985 [Treponema putidum]